MNIVHIGTADISGGAARAAYALHRGLLKLGHNSKMLVGYKKSKDPEIYSVWFNRGLFRRGLYYFTIGKLEEWTGWQYLIQPFRRVFLRHPFVKQADIIHLHNIHGNFFSYTILPELSTIAPLVWTLHDMWAMSDHCGYPEMHGCEIWKTGKGKCPALFDYPPIRRDTGAYLWKRKKESYEQSNITVVGPSRWMCKMAKLSPLMNRFPIHHIPYGIDSDTFSPDNKDKRAIRRLLDIPLNAAVILVSALPNAPRKGLAYFLEALKFLQHQPRPFLLMMGSKGLLGEAAKDFSIKEVGYLRDNESIANCFQAADLFVLPTLADNLPVTIQESLACGTPVVSFDVGGVSDLVRPGETGYLARLKDAKDIARGIDYLLSDLEALQKMGKRCREIVCAEYSMEQQAEKYVKLYEQCLSKKSLWLSKKS